MFVKLSKNAYVRQFDEYTYLFDRLNSADRIFRHADVFLRWIGRQPIEVRSIVENICKSFIDADPVVVKKDFEEFIRPLVNANLILESDTLESIDANEKFFSYDAEQVRTKEDTQYLTREEVEKTPHIILGKYFNEHPTPLRLHIDVTQACTERCVHCYIPEYNPVFLPFEKIGQVIDEARALQCMHVTFSGGECMMHPDFDKMLRYAYANDLTVAILSNLTLCDDEKIKLLKEVEATVQVSLYSMNADVHDSITKRKGSWLQTKTAIERLRENNIPCFIACPTMKQNFDSYFEVIDFAKSLNMSAQIDPIVMGKMDCDTSNLSCRIDLFQARKVLEDVVYKAIPMDSEYFSLVKRGELRPREELLNEPVCGAGVDSICLDSTGIYYPCPGFVGFKLGNCFENSFGWVWNESPEMKRLRAIRGRDFKKCASCKDADFCSICMCRNYNETGNPFEPVDYFCEVARMSHEIVCGKLGVNR